MKHTLIFTFLYSLTITTAYSYEQPKSHFVSLLTRLSALYTMEKHTNHPAQPQTDEQKEFLDQYKTDATKAAVNHSNNTYVECLAGPLLKVNKELKEKNIPIQLSGQPYNLATAALADIAFAWKNPGKKTSVHSKKQNYKASYFTTAPVFVTPDGTQIIQLDTEKHGTVFISPQKNNIPACHTDTHVFATIAALQKTMGTSQKTDIFDGIVIPHIQHTQTSTLQQLKGMLFGEFTVNDAQEYINLSMDEKGGHVQTATALSVRKSRRKNILTINTPFYMWNILPGVDVPLIGGYCAQDAWLEKQKNDIDSPLNVSDVLD